MTRPLASPLGRAAIVVLTVAIVLCVLIPMGGADGGMHITLTCCLFLAAALSLFLLRRPHQTDFARVFNLATPLAPVPARTARAPDIVAIGSLLN